MEPIQSGSENTSQGSCKESVNSLGVCYLEHSLKQGKTVEIPSLDIVIRQPSESIKPCKPEE